MNVAHHAVYPIWFELARIELLRRRGIVYTEVEARGYLFAVARMNIRYRRSAYNDDQLEIHCTMTKAGSAKMDHAYEVRRGDELLATAETTLACIDREGRMQRFPDDLDFGG